MSQPFRSEVNAALAEIRAMLGRLVAASEGALAVQAGVERDQAHQPAVLAPREPALDVADRLRELALAETELARQRTDLARTRTDLAERRTTLVEEQTDLLHTASILAQIRTEQSGARTYLSLIRAGLAFLTLGVVLVRYFGISWWTLFDAALVLPSTLATIYGVVGYRRSLRSIRLLDNGLPEEMRVTLQTNRDPHI
jgi:uncharacterized membrane protein YidH (DUF202 family)